MYGGKFGQSIDLNTEIEKEEKIKKILDNLNTPEEQKEKHSEKNGRGKNEESPKENRPEKKPGEESSAVPEKKEGGSPAEKAEGPEQEAEKPIDPLEEDVNGLLSTSDNEPEKSGLNWAKFAWVFCLAVILVAGLVSLTQTFHIPKLDDRAEATVELLAFSAAKQQIERDWPLISEQARELKAQKLAKELLKRPESKNKKSEYEAQLQGLYRTEKGLPYVYDIDPYYFMARAAGIETGRPDAFNFFEKLQLFAYDFVHSRDSQASFSDAVFYLPLIFGLLTLVFFFFLVWVLTKNLEIAFLAGIVTALHHRFFFATAAGMADTQSINLLFTAVFFLFALGAVFLWNKSRKLSAASAVIAVPVFLFFRSAWQGAFYVLAVLAAAAGIFVFVKLWKKRAFVRIGLIAAFLAFFAWIFSLSDFGKQFLRYVFGYLRFVQRSAAVEQIAELQGRNIQVFAVALGGWLPLIIALIGLVWLVIANYKNPRFAGIFIIVWFAAMAFATFQSNRFMYYAIFPVALLVGFVLHKASKGLRTVFSAKSIKANLSIMGLVFLLVLAMMLPYLSITQHKVLPKMNDGFAKAGLKIQSFTDDDARIISWWDYGHIWRYAAERNTLIDGGTQGTTFTYWIARSLMAQDIEVSEKIWKLLACKKTSVLPDDVFYDTLDSKQIGLSELEVNSSCSDPVPQVIIVNEEMIEVAPAIAQLAMAYDMEFYYGDIESTSIVSCNAGGREIICGNMKVDLETMTADGRMPVHFYANGTRTKSNMTGSKVAVVFLSNNNLFAFVTTSWLAETTMLRLFAGENLGLESLIFVDAPKRIAVYRHNAGIETEEELAAVLSAELRG